MSEPAAGKKLLVVQAEAYEEAKAREFGVSHKSAVHKDRFHFRAGDWQPWPRSPEPEVHIFPAWGWVNSILSVERVDFERLLVHVTNQNCTQELRLGNRYFVANVFEALDTPGEWYLDRKAGKIYYWPRRADFAEKGVFAPALDRLVDLRGDIDGEDETQVGSTGQNAGRERRFVEHVAFRGLTFKHTTLQARNAPRPTRRTTVPSGCAVHDTAPSRAAGFRGLAATLCVCRFIRTTIA